MDSPIWRRFFVKVNEEMAWRADVRRDGRMMFACTVTPRRGAWFISDCLPQRRDPRLAGLLLEICEELVLDHGATTIVAIHPEFWDKEVAAAGAVLLQRLVPMWARLDNDLLRAPGAGALPRDCRVTPLDMVVAGPQQLQQLSSTPDRDGDRHVWGEALGGDYGPVIPGASLILLVGSTPCGAIVVTEYQGSPQLAHVVVAEPLRGRGIGRALLVRSMRALAASGYVDCQLNVAEDNRIARRAFQSVGFIQNRPTQHVSYMWGMRHDRRHP
jgi:ribosomal protein S18 acetylase RimI-like enzyme